MQKTQHFNNTVEELPCLVGDVCFIRFIVQLLWCVPGIGIHTAIDQRRCPVAHLLKVIQLQSVSV